ncbi:MAG: tetratricopeptide repeat protein [Deltaproteobacteria bacterium]|nr:tetratricopeptide repeat protein [Deltaproteobacteria bacterium]
MNMVPELFQNPVFARCYHRWQSDPASTAFIGVADILRVLGEYEEAIRVCREGLRHNPQLVTARLILAQSLEALGRMTEAHAVLLSILAEFPNHQTARAMEQRLSPLHQRPMAAMLEDPVLVPMTELLCSADDVVPSGSAMADDVAEMNAFDEEEVTPVVAEFVVREKESDPLSQSLDALPDCVEEMDSQPDAVSPTTPPAPWTTMTMARLYAAQGYHHDAQRIYHKILANNPDHHEARAALDALATRIEGDD